MPIQFNIDLVNGLILLAIWAISCVYFWYLTTRSITDMSPGRKYLSLGLRLFIVTLLFLALANTRYVKKNDSLSVLFLVDASKSIREDQRDQEIKFVQDAVKYKRRGDSVGVITFGKDPYILSKPFDSFVLNSVNHHGPTNVTDIAQAMESASSLVPTGSAGKVVVLSDGNENVNHALSAVPSLTARGVAVDSVILPSSLKKEAMIDKMVLPSRVKIGEPFTVKVITNALNAQKARLTIRRDGSSIAPTKDIDVPVGKRVFTFDAHIDKPGFYKFEAQLETDPAKDTIVENNKGLGFVSVRGKPQILYVAENANQVPFLQRAMKDQNIDILYVPPSAMPTTAAAFQQFDSVIISDVPRFLFSQAQMQAIQISTRDFGVGFAMVGGQYSFGAGKYRNTPIEETLPVSLETKKEKRLPSVAVALVIEDLEIPNVVNMSKEAAKALIDLLDPMDQVGIVDCNGFGGFGGRGGDAGGTWRVPLQHVVDRAAIQSQIETLDGMGDPASYDPFLMEAARKLQASDAKIKHIIFLGDGDAAYEGMGGGVNSTMRKIHDMGITVSTVATAADPQGISYMAQMARDGGGHSYVADQPQDLPRILLKDQQTISAPPIIEEPFFPKQTPGDDVLSGIGAMPQLLGYNISTPKPTAGISLVSHRNDPILATWRYGLGRSMAFTSDDKNRWAVNWLPWSGYGQFWAQAIRWTMRSFTPSDFQTDVTMEGTRGHVVVHAIDKDGKFVNRLNFKAKVIGPDSDPAHPTPDTLLRQTGPGTYEAFFDAGQIGTYLVNVTREVPGKPTEMTVTGLVVPYSPEYKDLAANEFLMTQMAQAGGGSVAANPSQVFGGNRPGVFASIELSQTLILIAMLLFPFDVAVRRLALDKDDFVRANVWIRERTRRGTTENSGGVSAPDLSTLMSAKEKAVTTSRAETASKATKSEPEIKVAGTDPGNPNSESIPTATERTVSPTNLTPTTGSARVKTVRPDMPTATTPTNVTEPAKPQAPTEELNGMSALMDAKRRAQKMHQKDDDSETSE